jgi:regulator of nucleoside diphosphate kinase
MSRNKGEPAMSTEMVRETEALQPSILLSHDDYNLLTDLARATLARYPADDAQLLLEELHRADTVSAEWVPSGVVMMNSYVEFRDDRTGASRRVQLVYPYQADIKKGRISVLSLVGAALIGLAEGQSIAWQIRNGDQRRLTVLRARKEPFADDGDAAEVSATTAPLHVGHHTGRESNALADDARRQV